MRRPSNLTTRYVILIVCSVHLLILGTQKAVPATGRTLSVGRRTAIRHCLLTIMTWFSFSSPSTPSHFESPFAETVILSATRAGSSAEAEEARRLLRSAHEVSRCTLSLLTTLLFLSSGVTHLESCYQAEAAEEASEDQADWKDPGVTPFFICYQISAKQKAAKPTKVLKTTLGAYLRGPEEERVKVSGDIQQLAANVTALRCVTARAAYCHAVSLLSKKKGYLTCCWVLFI